MGDSILRKTDKTLSKGEDVVVCLPGARIEHVTDRVENVLGHGQGGSILVHVGTNNADTEGTTRIVQRYRQWVGKLKKTRVEQIILSGILPVIGGREQPIETARGWQSMLWWSRCVRRNGLDSWICGGALLGKRTCT